MNDINDFRRLNPAAGQAGPAYPSQANPPNAPARTWVEAVIEENVHHIDLMYALNNRLERILGRMFGPEPEGPEEPAAAGRVGGHIHTIGNQHAVLRQSIMDAIKLAERLESLA